MVKRSGYTLTALSSRPPAAAGWSSTLLWACCGKKRGQVTPSTVGCFVGAAILVSNGGCRRIFRGWPLGIWLWWRRRRGLKSSAFRSWEIEFIPAVPKCQEQLCLSAEPSQWSNLTRNLAGTCLSDSGPQMKSLSSCGTCSAPIQAGGLSHRPAGRLGVALGPA